MKPRKIALIVAAGLALLFGIGMFFFVRSFQTANSAEVTRVRVLVSNVNIDKGVTVTPAQFRAVLRDRTTVDPDAISDPAMLHGQFALIALPVGSILTQSKIGTPRDVGLSMRLKPGERAVSMSVDHVKDVSGLILPGDRVDVLVQGPRIDNRIVPAQILLRGVLVLAVGQGLETTSGAPSTEQINAATITFALDPHQATLLLTADQNATIRLALRSPKERLSTSQASPVLYNGTNGGYGTPDRRTPPTVVPAPVAVPAALPPAVAPPMPLAPTQKQSTIKPRPAAVTGIQVIDGSTVVGPG